MCCIDGGVRFITYLHKEEKKIVENQQEMARVILGARCTQCNKLMQYSIIHLMHFVCSTPTTQPSTHSIIADFLPDIFISSVKRLIAKSVVLLRGLKRDLGLVSTPYSLRGILRVRSGT
jgi:hypothetical protein